MTYIKEECKHIVGSILQLDNLKINLFLLGSKGYIFDPSILFYNLITTGKTDMDLCRNVEN